MTVAPTGEDVTGILCVRLRVSVAQFGANRTLVRVRKIMKRFALAFFIGPPSDFDEFIRCCLARRVKPNFDKTG
jgi:hypothetical protein